MEQEIPINLWLLSGIIGACIRDSYSFIVVKLLGLTKHFIWDFGATIFIKESEINTIPGTIIGLLADLVISCLLSIIICALIDWQRKRHYLIYGLGVSLTAWLLFFGIVLHDIHATVKNAPVDLTTNIIAIIGHLIFGLVTAFVYVKLSRNRK